MKKVLLPFAIVLLTLPVVAQIQGDYLESRSTDVFTGQCYANGEMGLNGKDALLAWHISHGSWNGVALDGLSIAAAVRAKATLGDPYENPYPAKAVLFVDDQATPRQREALTSFAQNMAGRLLDHVEKVVVAPVALELSPTHMGAALLRAGSFAVVQTRAIGPEDHNCGNDATFYPPLTPTTHAMPVVAMTDRYDGPALGSTWDSHGRRSAFVGTFAVGANAAMMHHADSGE
jgi:hypothetical protein